MKKKLITIVTIIAFGIAILGCSTDKSAETISQVPTTPQAETASPTLSSTQSTPTANIDMDKIDPENKNEDTKPGYTVNEKVEVTGVESEEILKNYKEYIGKTIEVEVTIYGEPTIVEGMLFFTATAGDEANANVSILDENFGLKKGDKVVITGIISSSIEDKDPAGKTKEMALIAAQSLSHK
ncbi:MAG: hypothetical protein RR716_01785 [Christensenellaceae bacterium]